MKKALISAALWVFGTAFALAAMGQQQTPDVGLVSEITGDVGYSNGGSPSKPIQPYMRVRQGDRIVLAQGSVLQISYFTAGVKETWKGAATFVATNAGGELLKGNKPEVAQLPGSVANKLARVPALIAGTRTGGITVRALSERPDPAKKEKEVAEAMANYEAMRASARRDDIIPELYLFSVLQEYEMYDDLKVVAQELVRRQPQNRELADLAMRAIKRADEQ